MLCRDFVLGTAKWPELRVIVNESKKSVVSASQTVRYIYLENLWKLPDRISFVSRSRPSYNSQHPIKREFPIDEDETLFW